MIVFLFSENLGHKSRLHGWRDVAERDIKIFLAHLIAMGLVRKGSMLKYWDHGETVKTALELKWDRIHFRAYCQTYRCQTPL